jgi:hypothetical protein
MAAALLFPNDSVELCIIYFSGDQRLRSGRLTGISAARRFDIPRNFRQESTSNIFYPFGPLLIAAFALVQVGFPPTPTIIGVTLGLCSLEQAMHVTKKAGELIGVIGRVKHPKGARNDSRRPEPRGHDFGGFARPIASAPACRRLLLGGRGLTA